MEKKHSPLLLYNLLLFLYEKFNSGLWGVVMNAKDVTMPYDDTNKALSLLHQYCPQSCFSYPPGGLIDEVSYKTYPILDIEVNGIATVHELTMMKFERECEEKYRGKNKPFLVDVTVDKQVFGNNLYGANDVKFRIVADETSIGLAYDDPPESDVNKTLRLVFGLTFWQAYRDHADKMSKQDDLADLFEHAFYRRKWHDDGGTWINNRNFWGLGDNDWKWKYNVLTYLIDEFITGQDSPLHPYLDVCKVRNDAHGAVPN